MEKPLKVAAWSGLISLIVSILFIPFMFVTNPAVKATVSLLMAVVGGVFGIFFLHGFLVLGKKFKTTLLVVMTWIGIAILILSLVFGVIGNIIALTTNASAQDENTGFTDVTNFPDIDADNSVAVLFVLLFFWVIFSLVIGAYTILFGIGILKLKDKVPYAKTAGILDIIAGATFIIFVGFFVRLVAYAFEIAMMFKASQKFER